MRGGSQERIVELPDGAVYDAMFHNWSMREVVQLSEEDAKPKPKGGKGKPCDNPTGGKGDQDSNPSEGGTGDKGDEWDTVEVNGKTYDISQQDEHDFEKLLEGLTHEQVKESMTP
jgi:hypothetical protein